MIGKVIGGKSFGGSVGYVMKSDAEIIDSQGVEPPEVRDMVQDFEDQALLNPRVKNCVGHISLSFSEQDKSRLSNDKMTEIAREYMQRMGITDTQYLVVRHHDAPHPHCHIVYNCVRNDGSTVPDSNIRLRNVAVCHELTEKHGLYLASGKEQVRVNRLREPDKTKYEIYGAIKNALPNCKSWNDLQQKLAHEGVGVGFKYKENTGIKEGVKFSKGAFTFSGSKIDQKFSYSKLDNHFRKNQAPKYSAKLQNSFKSAVGRLVSAIAKCGSVLGKGGGGEERTLNLSQFGGGSISLPPNDLGIGITASQMQRQPDELPEQHIARITALINAVAAAMINHAEEQKRRAKEVKKPKLKL